ncbi:MAG: branched-chain amino acid aminotransferase [Clostridia bacterium]|nr:branched-chain amino acid aminotransferase [Clostridia bacterium]
MLNIKIEKTTTPRQKPDYNNLGFGRHFTDHMFIMDYSDGAWNNARIVPYQDISLSPAAMVFHYGQEMFEGLKAYYTADGKIQLFRPQKNIERLNRTNDRICIPELDPDDVLQAIKAVVEIDKEWIPTSEGTSLYIRPFIIATEPHLGVAPSKSYMFIIILSPVASYYAEGLNPVKIYIENKYVRAVKGGTGFAKIGGNYVASLKAQMEAKALGYSQVLWLDGVEHKYVDEVGAMNVFFVVGDEVITPSLDEGSILPGVTRDSCLALLRKWGIKATERRITIDELSEAYDKGELKEVFGTGTAAVISPVGELNYNGKVMTINDGKIGTISQKLYDVMTGIQWGKLPDDMGWIERV